MAFPIVLANGPPADRLQEVAGAGVTMVRTGIANWSEPQLTAQIAAERAPPPPIVPADQKFRSVAVADGGFRDWFAPHDVHVYRFGA